MKRSEVRHSRNFENGFTLSSIGDVDEDPESEKIGGNIVVDAPDPSERTRKVRLSLKPLVEETHGLEPPRRTSLGTRMMGVINTSQRAAAVERAEGDLLDDFISKDLTGISVATHALSTTEESEKPPFVFFDDAPVRLIWDCMLFALIMFYVCVVPLRVAFSSTTGGDFIHSRGTWFALDLSSDLIFIMDIVFNFRTAFRKPGGELITDPVKIRYVRARVRVSLTAPSLVQENLPNDVVSHGCHCVISPLAGWHGHWTE